MHITLAALTLASAILAPAQEDVSKVRQIINARNATEAADAARVASRMESKLGFTIYEPRFLEARELMRYVSQLTDEKIKYFYEDPTYDKVQLGSRRRFIDMGDVIGVQDFDEGRAAAMAVLLDIDTRLGAVKSDVPARASAHAPQVRTVRLRTIDTRTATILLNTISPELAVSAIYETGTIVLRGPVEAVGIAESLLLEVDQPLPQITLRCVLIQAVDANDTDTTGLMDDEVARSLGRMLPGKRFRKVGELLLRGSAGGNAEFEVTSSLPGFGQNDSVAQARVSLTAVARALDPDTKTLTLDKCSMQLEIPTFQVTGTGQGSLQSNFAGYRSEGLRADLALRAGETTVVGSLGGDQIYVSLSFTIEE